jgi:hypothetical protein
LVAADETIPLGLGIVLSFDAVLFRYFSGPLT